MFLFPFFLSGDTLIEVMFAVGIFGLVAISAISLMNRGLQTSQRTLETTMARQEIDTQAEALRFIHEAYISEESMSENPYAELWEKIIEKSYSTAALLAEVPDFYSGYNGSVNSCAELYENLPKKSFVINPRLLGTNDLEDLLSRSALDELIIKRNLADEDDRNLHQASTYPRLLYGLNLEAAEDVNLSDADARNIYYNQNFYSAEGIWVTAVQSQDGIDCTSEGGDFRPDFYDFYIRTCWDAPGGKTSSTVGTTIRLHNSDQFSVNLFPTETIYEKMALYFVMTWTGNNGDIDAHFYGDSDRAENGSPFRIYYGSKNAGEYKNYDFITSGQAVSTFQLDVDAIDYTTGRNYCSATDTWCGNGNGDGYVEVIAFRSLFAGQFHYATHDYRRNGLENNNLTVRVYSGFADEGIGQWPRESAPIATFHYSGGVPTGGYWEVATIDVTDDGRISFDGGATYSNLEIPVGGSIEKTTICGTVYKPTYMVNFDANGGQGEMGARVYNVGEAGQLPDNLFTYPGHSFTHWNLAPDNSSTSFADHAFIRDLAGEGETVTLYAQWGEASYNIVYDPNGGTGTMDIQRVARGTTVGLSPNAFTKTNAHFTGWNTKADGTGTSYSDRQSVTDIAGSNDSITLYAQWAPDTYQVIFRPNGGTPNSNQVQVIDRGVPTALNQNIFSRQNQTFTGWNTKADGTGTSYSDRQIVTDIAERDGSVVLYAQWRSVGCGSVPVMQNWNNSELLGIQESMKLCDTRDYQYYNIAKLRDGNIWMIDNLALGDIENYPLVSDLTSENTNLYSSITISTFNSWEISATVSGNISGYNGNLFSDGQMFATRFHDPYSDSSYGTIYNYYAASAGTIGGGNNRSDANYDICPAGWRLPTLDEFRRLYDSYNITANAANVYMHKSVVNGGAAFARRCAGTEEFDRGPCSSPSGTIGGMAWNWSSTALKVTNEVSGMVMGFVEMGYSDDQVNFYYGGRGYLRALRCILKSSAAQSQGTYQIIFKKNDGTTTNTVQQVRVGDTVNLIANPWSRDNYTFTGWNTKADGSGTSYSEQQSVTDLAGRDEAIVLYAQWESIRTCENAPYMQNWDGADSLGLYETTYLIDRRDGECYPVIKLKDGHVWLQKNLRLDFSDLDENISASNTNNPTRAFISEASRRPASQSGQKWKGHQLDSFRLDEIVYNKNFKGNYNAIPTDPTHTYDDIGVYYNWYTATAGNMLSVMDIPIWYDEYPEGYDVSGDICPIGWHLPTRYEFKNMFTKETNIQVEDTPPIYFAGDWLIHPISEYSVSNFQLLPLDLIWGICDYRTYGNLYDDGFATCDVTQLYKEPGKNTTETIWLGTLLAGIDSANLNASTGWAAGADQSGGSSPWIGNTVRCITNPVSAQPQGTYQIIFNKNDGSGDTAVQQVNVGDTVNLAANQWTRSDYTFTGWNTRADGSGTAYSNRQSVTNLAPAGGSITLYAQWENPTYYYTVTYDGNGATSGSTESQTVPAGTSINLATNGFSKTNYHFTGWALGSASGTSYSAGDSYTVNSDVTFYAKWAPDTYQVIFRPNGGTPNTYTTQTIARGVPTELTENPFGRDGHTFTGWNTKADGTGASYSDRQSVTNLAGRDEAIVLYAQWEEDDPEPNPEPVSYTVTYDGNGATSGSTESQTVPAGTSINLATNGFSKTNYHFTGWALGSASGMSYNERASYTVNSDVTFYAEWTRDTYQVIFNPNGGTPNQNQVQTINRGVPTALNPNIFSHSDYKFTGWNTKADGSGTSYSDGQTVTDLASRDTSINLYAQWEVNNSTSSCTSGAGITICNYELNSSGQPTTNPVANVEVGVWYCDKKPDTTAHWAAYNAATAAYNNAISRVQSLYNTAVSVCRNNPLVTAGLLSYASCLSEAGLPSTWQAYAAQEGIATDWETYAEREGAWTAAAIRQYENEGCEYSDTASGRYYGAAGYNAFDLSYFNRWITNPYVGMPVQSGVMDHCVSSGGAKYCLPVSDRNGIINYSGLQKNNLIFRVTYEPSCYTYSSYGSDTSQDWDGYYGYWPKGGLVKIYHKKKAGCS